MSFTDPVPGVPFTDADGLDDITQHLRDAAAARVDETENAIAPARTTWAAAGGAAPTIGAVDLGGGATAPTMSGTPAVLSSFNRIGKECFATMRIHATGSGALVGGASIVGLPVAPKPQGVSGEGGQNVGYGFMFNAGAGIGYFVNAILDPTYSTTVPILFLHAGLDADDVAGDGGPRAAALVGFSGEPFLIVSDNKPFNFNATQFFLNLALQYEGV